MDSAGDPAARKQLLLARSALYRLRLQHDALSLRESFSAPARGLALVKFVPIAMVVLRLVTRGRGAGVLPSVVEIATIAAGWILARRPKDG